MKIQKRKISDDCPDSNSLEIKTHVPQLERLLSDFLTFEKVLTFKAKPITIAVAESILLAVITDPAIAYDWSNPPSAEASTGFKAVEVKNFVDTLDGTSGQTLYFLQGSNPGDKKLDITVTQEYPMLSAWNAFYDKQFYIVGGFRTLPGGSGSLREPYFKALGQPVQIDAATKKEYVTYDGKNYWLTSDGKSTGEALSSGASRYIVNFNVSDGATGTFKIYGARSELFNPNEDRTSEDAIGASNWNKVNINFIEKSVEHPTAGGSILTRIVFGGRSAQMEGWKTYEGYKTNHNEVHVKGTQLKGVTGWVFDSTFDANALTPELISRAGVWGAEGYETDCNYVNVVDSVITGATPDARKYGLIGGRGFFSYRLNTGENLAESAISNNNIVVVKNSAIGFENNYSAYDSRDGSGTAQPKKGQSFSVIGGYSPGKAENNIVVLEDVRINGNVYGAFELKNKMTGENGLRSLDPNLVSLRNVSLEKGSSIYGTATGDTQAADPYDKDPLPIVDWNATMEGQQFFDERKMQAVNRRRGVVDIAERVETDSLYARYVQFGQYIKTNIQPGIVVDVTSSYFPHTYEDTDSVVTLDTTTSLEQNTAHLTYGETGFISLGQQVAGSYVINRNGFHSDLSPKDKNIESSTTTGKHNFWVGAYVNTVDQVDGDGTSFNTKENLFKDGDVNHLYGEEGDQVLSLLTHDDGMLYSKESGDGSQNPSLMHHFRYNYQGLVLFTGVSEGKEGSAIQISFDEIAEFRKSEGQNTNAFGNTFIGIIKDGKVYFKGSASDGDTTTDQVKMTFDVPYSIYQRGEKVADAVYSFYKYMHFDGSDDKFTDGSGQVVDGKVTAGVVDGVNTAAGIGIKYWLKEIQILPQKQLVLNGAKEGDRLEVENFQADSTTKRKQELYTLSAHVTGSGGVAIAQDSTVVIGTPSTIYTINSLNQPNEYSGLTTVGDGATLIFGIDGAIGSNQIYTSGFLINKGASVYLQGHTQTVGALKIAENAKVDFGQKAEVGFDNSYQADLGGTGGELTVKGDAEVDGLFFGEEKAKLIIDQGVANINSRNSGFSGTVELKTARGYLNKSTALENAQAVVSAKSSLYFTSAESPVTRDADPRSAAYIRGVQNAGDVFLSSGEDKVSNLNHVNVAEDYLGESGSVIHYRGLVQGANNSYVDVIHSDTASGTSKVSFGDDHNKIPVSGIFKEARGEKTLKSEGIPIFVIADKGIEGNQLRLEMQPFGVVAKDNEAYKWIYSLGYNDEEQGSQRTWVLYNSDDKDHYEPLVPPKEEENLVLRPEAGAYVGASQSWAKMHMRLHDRFGQAYYIDPFDGEEKPAAAWIRQVGSHSHFRMAGGQSKTHSNTAVTQIGGDLLRNEFNEDWKYIGGVFAGGLYNRSDSRSWDSAKSRSDGYSLGVYGTLYTGNSPDDGFYVDSWLLFGRYDNKIWSDEISPFKFKSHGWVWSVETGYTIPIGESGSKDYNKLIWTFQPEAQLVWDGVKANSANDSFGTKYRQLGTDNVTLRVGARLHANYMNKGLGFIEGNWIHNSKKAGVQMGTDKVYMDGGRNLGEFRMGLEGHLSRNMLGWATVGVQAGKSGYHNETAQIGIKYMF